MLYTLATNENNDIYLDKYGNLATVSGAEAVGEVCRAVIETQYQEMPFRQDLGIDYLNRVFVNSQIGSQFLDASIRKALKDVKEVKKIKSLSTTFANNVLSYVLIIESVYGTTTVQSTLT